MSIFGLDEDNYRARIIIITYETLFFLNVIVKFLTEYVPDGETCAIRDLKLISRRYMNTTLIWDVIPLFPITFFLDTSKEYFYRVFYFLKVMRIAQGL